MTNIRYGSMKRLNEKATKMMIRDQLLEYKMVDVQTRLGLCCFPLLSDLLISDSVLILIMMIRQ